MNKRANLYLDIYEFIAFILSLSCIGLCMTLGELSFPVPVILNYIILGIGALSAIIFISIEVFLFLLMKTKSRIFYLLFMIIDVVCAIFINRMIPFSAFLVFIFFSMMKDIIRIKLVDKLYIPREFNRYCRMFNIKVKDFPKKRKVTSTPKKEKEQVKVKVEKPIYVTETKKNSKSDKSFA